MSSSPPVLPISSPTSTVPGDSTAALPRGAASSAASPISVSVLRLFISRIADAARRSLAHRRPWSELIDRSAFARPDSLSDAASRIRRNLGYFRVNYLALLVAALSLSLLTHPFSLLLLAALFAAWSVLYLFRPADAPPVVLFRRSFSDREVLASLVLVTILVVFLTSVGSVIFSALSVGAALIGVHGALRMPEDLFLDEQDISGPAGGLLSLFGGGASSGPAIRV